MFGMSVADILGSVAMALTTLPMPTLTGRDFMWNGARIGNHFTCCIQGFFQMFGTSVGYGYNCSLCLYYFCAMALQMREKCIRTRVEWMLHSAPIIAGLIFVGPTLFLHGGSFIPEIDPWCTITVDNSGCHGDIQCTLDTWPSSDDRKRVLTGIIGSLIMVASIILCLALVALRVFLKEREVEMTMRVFKDRNCNHDNFPSLVEKQRNTRVVLIQAFAYIAALSLTLTFPVIRWCRKVYQLDNKNATSLTSMDTIDLLSITFLPLQGFFNLFIFISHKIYNYKRVEMNASTCETIRCIFCTAFEEPIYLSMILLVKRDVDDDDDEFEFSFNDEVESSVVRRKIELEDIDCSVGDERSKSVAELSRWSVGVSEAKPGSSAMLSMDLSSTGFMSEGIGGNPLWKPSIYQNVRCTVDVADDSTLSGIEDGCLSKGNNNIPFE